MNSMIEMEEKVISVGTDWHGEGGVVLATVLKHVLLYCGWESKHIPAASSSTFAFQFASFVLVLHISVKFSADDPYLFVLFEEVV